MRFPFPLHAGGACALALLAACSASPPMAPPARTEADAAAEVAAQAATHAAVLSERKREARLQDLAAGSAADAMAERAQDGALMAPPPPAATPVPAEGASVALSKQAPCCAPALPPAPVEERENYAPIASHAVQRAAEQPLSTFSIDVDTGSYSNVRRFLAQGRLPPQDAVRVEELLNYFHYDDPAPRDARHPFALHTELAPTPWNAKTWLLRVGIQGWKPTGPRPASNLVFLVDVSGSMADADKLPLVKAALQQLTAQLDARDRISLVVYAGASGVVLEPTRGDRHDLIADALERLQAGGSTNGGEGIRLAYALAQQAYIKGGNNRVLLATDGDFNVGTTSFEQLVDLVEERRRNGVALTTLGFGSGNYNDHLMEQLADAGNGNHAYIDSLAEAQRVLVENRDATLQTIARDVKVQIEFNPAQVSEYRLIGYEKRALRREDFSNDRIDAGEIGAGHHVTALYELALLGAGGERIEPLRYGKAAAAQAAGGELAFLRLRYKRPDEGMDAASRLVERVLTRGDLDRAPASADLRWAAAVAAFGQLLRGGQYTGSFRYTDVEDLARSARGPEVRAEAAEFLQLVRQAAHLSGARAAIAVED
jgi:Ca-activated chloride channel family protein